MFIPNNDMGELFLLSWEFWLDLQPSHGFLFRLRCSLNAVNLFVKASMLLSYKHKLASL